ncbi:MAG: AAA-like domain-containing protein [Cyanobacteria bacterium J06560_6]
MNQVEFEKALDDVPKRKREVLKLFLMGHSDADIGKKLNIEANTVARHIAETCKIFGLSNGEGEHYCYRYDLFDIFIDHLPTWVSPEKIKEYRLVHQEEPPFPGRGLKAGSPFYIERSQAEFRSQSAIRQPGGLLRICAPRKMGKRSLLNRLIKTAKDDLEYRIATLSFNELEEPMLKSLDLLLKWFCETLSYELGLPATIEDHWNETVGCKTSCTRYLQSYVLTKINQPILIAMDDVDRLFESPAVAVGFFSLVRGWAEESKTKEIWENFRQIISYSTDVYIDFPTDQSPFNVGRPVTLEALSVQQVLTLARQYGGASLAQFGEAEAETLLGFVGGTPHLIQLALYHIYEDKIALADLQRSQRVFMNIYANHLESLERKLEAYPALLKTFKEVVAAKAPVKLNRRLTKQLTGLGVVQSTELEGQVKISCRLYQQYFDAQWDLG